MGKSLVTIDAGLREYLDARMPLRCRIHVPPTISFAWRIRK
jgi:hypothetical protein